MIASSSEIAAPGLKLRNTKTGYGAVSIALHWAVAGLLMIVYAGVYLKVAFDVQVGTSAYAILIQFMHVSVGLSIGTLLLFRLLWTLTNPKPRLEPGSRLAHIAARTVHCMLYAFLIAQPLTGWLGSRANPPFFGTFQIMAFRDTRLYDILVTRRTGMTYEQYEVPFDLYHKEISGPWIIVTLILIHVSAALYHHFIVKDNTLNRMLPAIERHRPHTHG